jgi:hypothetical protein
MKHNLNDLCFLPFLNTLTAYTANKRVYNAAQRMSEQWLTILLKDPMK